MAKNLLTKLKSAYMKFVKEPLYLKVLIIGVILVLFVGFYFYNVYTQTTSMTDTMLLERDAIYYAHGFAPDFHGAFSTYRDLEYSRLYFYELSIGQNDAKSQFEKYRSIVNADLDGLSNLNHRYGKILKTDKSFADLAQRWNEINSNPSLDSNEILQNYNLMIGDIKSIITDCYENGGIISDPDMGPLNMGIALFVYQNSLIDTVFKINMISQKIVTTKDFSEVLSLNLSDLVGEAKDYLSSEEFYVKLAYEYSPSHFSTPYNNFLAWQNYMDLNYLPSMEKIINGMVISPDELSQLDSTRQSLQQTFMGSQLNAFESSISDRYTNAYIWMIVDITLSFLMLFIGIILSIVIILDIRQTEHKRIFRESFYRAIDNIHNLYVEPLDKPLDIILNEFTDILVRYTDSPLVFVGILYPQDEGVKILAHSGRASEYLNGLKLSVNPDIPEGQGPAGIALRTLKPFLLKNVNSDIFSPWTEKAKKFRIKGIVNTAFEMPDKTRWIVAIHIGEAQVFSEEIVDLLENIARDLKTLLEYREGQINLAKVRSYQIALQKIQQKLLEIPSPESIYSLVVKTIAEYTDVQRVYVAVPQENSKYMRIVAIEGEGKAEISKPDLISTDPSDIPYGYFTTSRVFREGKKIILTSNDKYLEDIVKTMKSVRGNMVGGWPIFAEGESTPRGVLTISSMNPNYFSEDVVLLVDQMVTSMSIAITQYEQFMKFEWMGLHDFLTGLPNRAYFERSASEAISRAKREGLHLAVGIMDLDNFKEWNDTLGHPAGDELLKKVALNIKSAIRGGDGVARLGGDEFGFHIAFEKIQELELVSERLMLATSITSKEGINITCSIGWAIYPEDGNNFVTLFANADRALYAVKNGGRNNYMIFNEDISSQTKIISDIRSAFSKALDNGEIELFLQPQIDCSNGTVVGVEMLAKWKWGNNWIDAKDFDFNPIESDRILSKLLGQYTLLKAMTLREKLKTEIIVNIETGYFSSSAFIEEVRDKDGHGITIKVKSPDSRKGIKMNKFIEATTVLKARGFKIATVLHEREFSNDFLSVADEIHIDKRIIDTFRYDMNDFAFVSSTIQIEKLSGIRVVAEEIEDEETFELFRRMNGRFVQGDFISKPICEDEFMKWKFKKCSKLNGFPFKDQIVLYEVFGGKINHNLSECPLTQWFAERSTFYADLPAFKSAKEAHEKLHDKLIGDEEFRQTMKTLYRAISEIVDKGEG
jgi:diguanylate cyclase (GGDEF)-like protein